MSNRGEQSGSGGPFRDKPPGGETNCFRGGETSGARRDVTNRSRAGEACQSNRDEPGHSRWGEPGHSCWGEPSCSKGGEVGHSTSRLYKRSQRNLLSTKKSADENVKRKKLDDLLQDNFEFFADTQIILEAAEASKTDRILKENCEVTSTTDASSVSTGKENNRNVELSELFRVESQRNIIDEFKDDFVFSLPNRKKTKDVNKQEEINESNEFGFTQLCESTQILKQIDDQIDEANNTNDVSSVKGVEEVAYVSSHIDTSSCLLEDTTFNSQVVKELDTAISESKETAWDAALHISQYKQDMQTLFEQVESTIYDFGGESQKHSQRNIHELLEKTFKSPEALKRVLKTAEDSIKATTSQLDWTDDSLLANAMINMSEEGESIATLIKKALMENVHKEASPKRILNSTLKEEDFKSHGDFYGLPDKVKDMIKAFKGIDKLYAWQNECLQLPAIKSRKNLIYALPTSGGKTLVAEILLLREIICRRKNVLFILPYVAIVQEKVWGLSPFAVALEFLVEEYAAGKGTYPPRKRRRKSSLYVATIEKALGLTNSLIETGRLDEIGLVIVDELHLIGDRSRGGALEALLGKLMYSKKDIQIVGMSATIGNLSEIAEFLQADVYTKNFRPVELVEYVKCESEVAKVNWGANVENVLTFERKLDYKYSEAMVKIDPDFLGGLVMEVIPDGSCLIFCSNKKNCENVAVLLSRVVFGTLREHRKNEKDLLKKALVDEAGSLCHILSQSLTFGIAYHHSGLTSEERRIIEDGFRNGVVQVICCTSTLAAGVNLPAKRVIIRSPYIGRDFINLARYKQMVGRAGRAGFGELGESIVLCTPQELPRISQLLKSPMDLAVSSLHEENARGLRQLLLSAISLNLAETKDQLYRITNQTLLAVQRDRLDVDVKLVTRGCIKELYKMGALEVDMDASVNSTKTHINITNASRLVISKMGKASIKGGLDLSRASVLYADLVQAQSSLVLLTGLHLMYLVTPYDISEQITPTKSHYHELYTKLGARELQTAHVLGLNEAVACKLLSNRKITEIPERVLNRFYVTLMLYDLWNESPVYEVAQKYEINRGLIQNLMTSAATFASNVFHFCEEFEEFWAFSLLLKGMGERLSHCCVRELVPLMKLPAVKQNRAKQLYKAGFKTLQSIAKADPSTLMNIEFMSARLANQLIAAAKLILLERVENLREEAEDVLDGVNF